MRYTVNARFVTQPLTGIQRYCYEVSRLLRHADLVSPGPALDDYHVLRDRLRVKNAGLAGHAWEQLALPMFVKRGQPLLSPAGCGPLSHANQVAVVHDVAVLENPSWYSRGYVAWYRLMFPALARRARTIVTVSEYCKRRIVDLMGVPPGRIVVALEAASSCFVPQSEERLAPALARLGVQRPYFLAGGAVSPRKNFSRLTAAWSRVQARFRGTTLILVGRQGLRFSGRPSLGQLPAATKRLEPVNDDDLASLYSGATALLYPSLYEGFGLPILEAMACGCPVLTSGCTAMPEVAGDAAVLVDPFDDESISRGILQFADEGICSEFRLRGLRRQRQFSWSSTAGVLEAQLLA